MIPAAFRWNLPAAQLEATTRAAKPFNSYGKHQAVFSSGFSGEMFTGALTKLSAGIEEQRHGARPGDAGER
jgi:hypothetical protein